MKSSRYFGLTTLFLLGLQCPGVLLKAAGGEVALFDATKLFSPELAPKNLLIFSEEPDGYRFHKACQVDYWLDSSGALHAQKSIIYDNPSTSTNEIKDLFNKATHFITTWNASIQLCTEELVVAISGNELVLKTPIGPAGGPAHVIRLSSAGVGMYERSNEVMAQVFGGTVAFRNIGGTEGAQLGLKLNQYITLGFERILISDYSKLSFVIDATPVMINVKTTCVPVLPPAPYDAYAQTCYDRHLHGSQFRLALGNVQWIDSRCKGRDEADPVCKYYGDFLYMTLTLHDERREFYDGDYFLDPSTGSYIYRVDMRKFLAPGTTLNPFKVVGQRTIISGDLLSLLNNAIIQAESLRYLPPRLIIEGKKETDAQYLTHFVMSSANLGYEVSGLSGINYMINQFKFSGTHK